MSIILSSSISLACQVAAKVRVAGMDAGQVLDIGVPNSPSSRFRVKWRIDAKLRGLVRTDSVVTIGTEGVVGGTYLAVRPGSTQALEATALATIPSREPTELSELLVRSAGLRAAQRCPGNVEGSRPQTRRRLRHHHGDSLECEYDGVEYE